MKCQDFKRRNMFYLQKLSNEFQINIEIEDILEQYTSIFTSYEEDRNRLRILCVPKKTDRKKEDKKKRVKREVLVMVGIRTLKKMSIDMDTAKLKAELFCKLWQQIKNINVVLEQENLIQNSIKTIEEITGESYC